MFRVTYLCIAALLLFQEQCDFDLTQQIDIQIVEGFRPYFPNAELVKYDCAVYQLPGYTKPQCKIAQIETHVTGVSQRFVFHVGKMVMEQHGGKLMTGVTFGGYTWFVLAFEDCYFVLNRFSGLWWVINQSQYASWRANPYVLR